MNLTEAAQSNLLKLREDSAIAQMLDQINKCGNAAILGGAVRDWFFGNPPRDIDIVVDCPSEKLEMLTRFKAKKNRFGGYKLNIGKSEFDIWNLDSTWALNNDSKFAKQLVVVPETVFLNLDAVMYDIASGTIIDKGFSQTVESKLLDIMYEPNPYPYLCVSKSLLALKKYDLRPSQRLTAFIRDQEDRGYNQKAFNTYQKVSFGDTIFDYQECINRVR